MNTFINTTSGPGFLKELLRFILLLIVAQVVRATLVWLLNVPLGLDNEVASLLSFIGMALALWLIVRPSRQDLALDLRGTSKNIWLMYIALVLIILILLVANFLMDSSLWLGNLYGVIVVPWVEEALFRGLGWGRLSRALPQKWNGFLTWILTSVLFGLWHLGYVDTVAFYADKPVGLSSLAMVMIWKVLVGGFIGGLAGLARWKFDKLPAAVFIHAMFNIFGR